MQPPSGTVGLCENLYGGRDSLSAPEHSLAKVVSACPARQGGTVLQAEIGPHPHWFVGSIGQRNDRKTLAHKAIGVTEKTYA